MKETFETVESIQDLSPDEIKDLIPTLDLAQKESLLNSIEILCNQNQRKIDNLTESIEDLKKIDNILLRRVWRVFKKENKEKLSQFFKDLDSEINS